MKQIMNTNLNQQIIQQTSSFFLLLSVYTYKVKSSQFPLTRSLIIISSASVNLFYSAVSRNLKLERVLPFPYSVAKNYDIQESLFSSVTVSSMFFSISSATKFKFMLRAIPLYYYRKQMTAFKKENHKFCCAIFEQKDQKIYQKDKSPNNQDTIAQQFNSNNNTKFIYLYFMQSFHIKRQSLESFKEISTQKYFIYFFILIYMEVTQSNFAEALKIIDKLLPKVEYIAFDLEFTGLRFEKFERDHINYLPFEKYKKLKYVAETYQILQLGLSFVVFDDALKVYPFNFYLFPRNPIFFDKTLSMQLGCVKFNTENGMDWNKWIRQGINYIQLAQMQELQRNDKNKTVKTLLDNVYSQHENIVHFFLYQVDKVANSSEKISHKYKAPQFLFKTITNIFYKYIEQKNLDVGIELFPAKKEDDDDYIIITKLSRSEKYQKAAQKKNEICGFGILFQKIWSLKKPIIGHNCFLDLMYLHHCFIGNLPDNYFQFKQTLKNSGNTFYDTKYIAMKYEDTFGTETRLQDLIKYIQKRYKNRLTTLTSEGEFKRYSLQNPNLHEAGYDSYITLWVYMHMMKLRDDIDQCKNRININFSFFRMNIERQQDEIQQYYAQNLLRVNVQIQQNEDVKKKRMEMVKKMKEYFAQIDNPKACQIHEGYRQIFIEIRQNKREVLRCLGKMKGKVFEDVRTFAGFLQWQEERVRKAALTEINRQNRNNKLYEDKKYQKSFSRKESNNEKSDKTYEKTATKNAKAQ